MTMTVPVAIVLGCCVLSATYVGYREYEHRRDVVDADRLLSDARVQAGRLSVWLAPPVVTPDPRRSAEVVAASRSRRLAANERCVGGVVVVVEGSSYSQTGERCNSTHVVR